MINKCKISYEYIQYDGNNGKEVADFIKSKIHDKKEMKFVWEETDETCFSGVKKLMWKYFNPKRIAEEDAYIEAMYEGQYVLWDKLDKDVHVVSLHKFKTTYVEDVEETQPITPPSIEPIYPPQYPDDAPLNPYGPKRTEIWCDATAGTKIKK